MKYNIIASLLSVLIYYLIYNLLNVMSCNLYYSFIIKCVYTILLIFVLLLLSTM